ncbi:YqaA family protein [Hydrogenophaga sp.]|uniref:YqaA family protein n=1 Tax=Hydrogenophaga sp. TaxID=1904254 RepID=UPI0035B20D1D
MPDWLTSLLHWLSMPEAGLGTLFIVSFISATLIPVGSEAALFGLLKLNPDLFWPAIAVATVGNTAGGALNWLIGAGTHRVIDQARHRTTELHALDWLQRFGPKACLLSWLPVIGDPLCAVAGWLRFPFWPCVAYMAVGKLLRYVVLTALLLKVFPGGLPL